MNPATDRPIMRDFSTVDLAEAVDGCDVAGTVAVQSVHEATETDHLLASAERSALIAGVVGWADLTAGDLIDQLARWRDSSSGGYLVGLRHLVEGEPDPEWLDRPAVRRGLKTLGGTGLAFDLLVRQPQAEAALRAVRDCPDLRFVLDHLGKPPLSGDLESWSALMRLFAAEPNVQAKVSGLVTEADWQRWTPADLVRPIEVALDTFGPDRLMFGSDWPVCLLATDYATVLQTTRTILADRLGTDDLAAVLGRTATNFYRLQLSQ